MLIAFEGGEGCGKSTQARLLAARLGAVLTFEPGARRSARELRALLLDGGRCRPTGRGVARWPPTEPNMSPRSSSRRSTAGLHVVTDRYLYSSLAYQGYGRGLDLDAVRSLSTFAGAPEADLVILLTIPADMRRERLQGRLDRIEGGDEQFHERVEQGLLELAAGDPKRWVVIIATGAIEAHRRSRVDRGQGAPVAIWTKRASPFSTRKPRPGRSGVLDRLGSRTPSRSPSVLRSGWSNSPVRDLRISRSQWP